MVSDGGGGLDSPARARLNPCSNGLTPYSVTGYGAWVLILVLMEYGLWHDSSCLVSNGLSLNPCSNGIWSLTEDRCKMKVTLLSVLILVLMEYGLWPDATFVAFRDPSLNPCSNGIWSLTLSSSWVSMTWWMGLNPCSNGIWSLTKDDQCCAKKIRWSLNPCSNGIWSLTLWPSGNR